VYISTTPCCFSQWHFDQNQIAGSLLARPFDSLINICPRRLDNLPWIAKKRERFLRGASIGSRCCSLTLSLGISKSVRVLSKLAKNIWRFIFDTYFSTLCARKRTTRRHPTEILDTVRDKCIHTAQIRIYWFQLEIRSLVMLPSILLQKPGGNVHHS